jgi:hypothetical protein
MIYQVFLILQFKLIVLFISHHSYTSRNSQLPLYIMSNIFWLLYGFLNQIIVEDFGDKFSRQAINMRRKGFHERYVFANLSLATV